MRFSPVITGCDLYDPQEDRWAHGDLWAGSNGSPIGVFYACTDAKGEAAWTFGIYPKGQRTIFVLGDYYFERRGVIVFAWRDATCNQETLNFLNRWSPKLVQEQGK